MELKSFLVYFLTTGNEFWPQIILVLISITHHFLNYFDLLSKLGRHLWTSDLVFPGEDREKGQYYGIEKSGLYFSKISLDLKVRSIFSGNLVYKKSIFWSKVGLYLVYIIDFCLVYKVLGTLIKGTQNRDRGQLRL